MTFDAYKLYLCLMVGFTFTIGLSIGIWCMVVLRKDWNKIYIVKRRRIFVVTMLIAMFTIYFGWVAVDFVAGYFPTQTTERIYIHAYEILFMPATMIAIWMLLCRFWIFYYDSKIIDFETNKEWRMAIRYIY